MNIFLKIKSLVNRDKYIILTGIISENGVVKSSFNNMSKMGFTFIAYRKDKKEIIENEISIFKPIRSIDSHTDEIDSLSIIKVLVKPTIENGCNKFQLKKVLSKNINDKDLEKILEKILEKRKEPVYYNSKNIGQFILNRSIDWFEGKSIWKGKNIDIFFAGDLNKINKTESNADKILSKQIEIDKYIKQEICKELLPLKNESWLDENEEKITEEEFVSKISLDSIIVNNEDDYVMNFYDGNIFWGHCIVVEANLDGKVDYISIQG